MWLKPSTFQRNVAQVQHISEKCGSSPAHFREMWLYQPGNLEKLTSDAPNSRIEDSSYLETGSGVFTRNWEVLDHEEAASDKNTA